MTTTPRQRAQQAQINREGRPSGVCLHRCQTCGNQLQHVGLSHRCGTCKTWREPAVACDNVWRDYEAMIQDRMGDE